MAQGDTNITIVGNLVADPELRYTASSIAVANFRVASTPRRFNGQTNQWEDGEALFLNCNVWRQAAENVKESLTKGMRVIVTGRLRQRSFETQAGEKRTVFEVEVDEVGPALRNATANVQRNAPQGGGQGGGGFNAPPGAPQGGFGGGAPQGAPQGGFGGGFGGGASQGGFGGGSSANDQAQQDPWNSAPQSGGFDPNDEPPF